MIRPNVDLLTAKVTVASASVDTAVSAKLKPLNSSRVPTNAVEQVSLAVIDLYLVGI
jgi:hypothetical protein